MLTGKSPEVFKKYRKEDIVEVINTTLYNYVKNAFRIQLNNYTTDELVSKREEFEKSIEDRLSKELLAENFQLEQMTSGLQYPQTLVNSIDAKNAAIQQALKAENEVKTIEAEAKKKVAAAQREAEALKIKGDVGGTFLGELKVLKERYPDSKFEIIVCHAVNIKGLVKLCNNFDRVIITNSYCDYGYKPSNNNLTVIDVCG